MIELIHQSDFYELTALLMLAAIIGFIGLQMRQPLIVSFIALGILVSPSVLGVVHSQDHIHLLAELGIAVLLFLVGLKLDVKLVQALGAASAIIGLGQISLTVGLGFGICLLFGLDMVTAIYVAIALAFSSTIIIVKMLSDKKEIDALHGRVSLGVLIVQDLVVVIAMMVLSALGAKTLAEDGGVAMEVARVIGSGVLMLCFVIVFIRYIANPLMQRFARSQELLICFAIGWAALLAALGHYIGFSKELGGLLAGISLASTPYREAIISRLSSLRDFLLLFFFISLGAELEFDSLGAHIPLAITLSVFVLLGKPLIIMGLMGRLRYRKRTGFLAGTMLGQISEFSLILMALGLSIGHINQEALGLVTLIGLITIALSVYFITYSHALYQWLEPSLALFETRAKHGHSPDTQAIDGQHYDVILFGIGRFGNAIAKELMARGKQVLAVDFNPDSVRQWRARGMNAVYGDACDPEFMHLLPLDGAAWVISAMPQHDIGLTHEDPRISLIEGLRANHFAGRIAVTTHKQDEIAMLEQKGAHVVLLPFDDAASQAVNRILG